MSASATTGPATPLRIGPALRRWAIPLILAALVALFQSAEPAFLRMANLFSVLQAVSVTTLLGVGITLTLAVGGFDLSAGSVAAFSMMAASYFMVVLGL